MIDSDELLAIGAALVQTVRSKVKYSSNMRGDKQLFKNLEQSSIYKKYLKETNAISQEMESLRKDYRYFAKKILQGYGSSCHQLSIACLYIAENIEMEYQNKIYFSIVCLSDHVFILAHDYIGLKLSEKRWDSFMELANFFVNKTAVIIDPWIYKATNIEDYISHINHAKMYHVEKFYDGSIESNKEYIELPIYNKMKCEYISTFNEYYKKQKQKLANRRNSFAMGRRYSSVRRSLEYNIQQQQQQLTSLRDFFTRLNNQSSYWYSHLGHSDNKGACINYAINYLNNCINNYDYPEEAKLINLFQSILRILPIVRSSNTAPRNLSVDTIDMTKSANGIFNLAVTPQEKYAFEDMDGFNLDWIRDSRNLNDRRKYEILLGKIAGFTAPYNLDEILRNFYTNKAGYYQLVTDAITQ